MYLLPVRGNQTVKSNKKGHNHDLAYRLRPAFCPFHSAPAGVPCACGCCCSWVIFFLQDYRKRIDIAGGNLLLLIAFNFTISSDLPRLGYLTFMDSILFTAFVITSLTVIASVMLRYIEIHGRVGLARRIDYFIIWTYLLLYAAGIAIAYKMYF